jgi:hypothetical protein
MPGSDLTIGVACAIVFDSTTSDAPHDQFRDFGSEKGHHVSSGRRARFDSPISK